MPRVGGDEDGEGRKGDLSLQALVVGGLLGFPLLLPPLPFFRQSIRSPRLFLAPTIPPPLQAGSPSVFFIHFFFKSREMRRNGNGDEVEGGCEETDSSSLPNPPLSQNGEQRTRVQLLIPNMVRTLMLEDCFARRFFLAAASDCGGGTAAAEAAFAACLLLLVIHGCCSTSRAVGRLEGSTSSMRETRSLASFETDLHSSESRGSLSSFIRRRMTSGLSCGPLAKGALLVKKKEISS